MKLRLPRFAQTRHRETWSSEQVILDGDEFFAALIAAIDGAVDSIEIEAYIYAHGRIGDRVTAALMSAAQRGVRVRLVVDGIGSAGWTACYGDQLEKSGARFRVFHRLPWDRVWRGQPPGRKWSGFLRLLLRVNKRNHRKLYLIDRKIAFVGSFNITDQHCREFMGDRAWHDAGARLEGTGLELLSAAFEYVWTARSTDLKRRLQLRKIVRRANHLSLVRLNATRKGRKGNFTDLLLRIVRARRRVWLTPSYFVPPGILLQVISLAAQSGVDVRIMVSRDSDVVFMSWVTSAFHYSLLKAGVRIFEFPHTMVHAKTIVIDDWCMLGSSNLNYRSLIHDLEADVVLTHDRSLATLVERFLAEQEQSTEIRFSNWTQRPVWERVIGQILLLGRRVL
jgi:cardiolipin synthase A/B